MNAIDNALTAGMTAARSVSGRDLVYHRESAHLEFRAIKGKYQERAVDGTVVVAEVELTDWIFPIAELSALTPAEPDKTDWVEADGLRYDVAEVAGQGWWNHSTPDRTWIRLHTVVVNA